MTNKNQEINKHMDSIFKAGGVPHLIKTDRKPCETEEEIEQLVASGEFDKTFDMVRKIYKRYINKEELTLSDNVKAVLIHHNYITTGHLPIFLFI